MEIQEEKLELYKLWIEQTEKLGDKRVKTNQLFIVLNTAIISLFSANYAKILEEGALTSIFIALFGGFICYIWNGLLIRYRAIVSAKFHVIDELEKELSFQCNKTEWEFFQSKGYKSLSYTEQLLPIGFGIAHIMQFTIHLPYHKWLERFLACTDKIHLLYP